MKHKKMFYQVFIRLGVTAVFEIVDFDVARSSRAYLYFIKHNQSNIAISVIDIFTSLYVGNGLADFGPMKPTFLFE